MIDSFHGENFFLSNMYPLKFHILTGETSARTSEHAYQAAKFVDPATHHRVAWASAQDRGLGEKLDGIAAKNMAHELIDAGEPMRPNWQNIKLGVMYEVVRRKFIANPDIRELLAATGGEPLVEGNDWGDTFWGQDSETKHGENHLGQILEHVRTDIIQGRYS